MGRVRTRRPILTCPSYQLKIKYYIHEQTVLIYFSAEVNNNKIASRYTWRRIHMDSISQNTVKHEQTVSKGDDNEYDEPKLDLLATLN